MLKEVLKNYLDMMIEWHKEKYQSYPTVDVEMADEPSICFFGEIKEGGYIQWSYVEQSNLIDFDALEEEFQIHICDEVKQFYNSYFFLELYGFLDGEVIEFDPVTDDTEDIFVLSDENHPNFVRVGSYGNTPLSLCVDMESGKVYTWDYSDDTYEFEYENRYPEPELLADSLSDVLSRLSLERA